MSESKPCERPGCPVQLVRRPGEKRNRWVSRRFCSRSCSSTHHNAQRAAPEVPVKHCAGCGARLVLRDGERVCHFRTRATCGPRCLPLARRRADEARRAARGLPAVPAPRPVRVDAFGERRAQLEGAPPGVFWRPPGHPPTPAGVVLRPRAVA